MSGLPSPYGASRGVEVVPLSARIGAMVGFRLLFVGALLGLGTLDPSVSTRGSLLTSGIYLALTGLLSAAVLLPSRAIAVRCFGVSLLVDGIYVQYQRETMHHGLATDVALTALLVAVFLLASFRTGLKVAVWQSVLLLVTLRGQETGLFPPPASRTGIDGETELLADLVMLWLVVVTTAVAAATNERELRRRRYDAEALARFAALLHRDTRPEEVAADVLGFAVEELGAERALVARSVGGRLAVVAGHGLATAPAGAELLPSALLDLPRRADGVALALRMDPVRDPWLATLLPQARRLLVVTLADTGPRAGHDAGPVPGDNPGGNPGADRTALVVVLGRRTDRAERRVVEAAAQAAATASLAWSRAQLLMAAERRAATDGLTGLANRRTFDARLRERHTEWERRGTPFALLLVDVDHFKSVNDRFGHQVGDEVLQVVARLLAEHAGALGGTAFRYGGEEFAILLAGTDVAGAAALGETCRAALRAVEQPVRLTASFGVALLPEHAVDTDALVRASDAALIAAKNSGRDRVVIAGDHRMPAAVAPRAGGRPPARRQSPDFWAPVEPDGDAVPDQVSDQVSDQVPGPRRRDLRSAGPEQA